MRESCRKLPLNLKKKVYVGEPNTIFAIGSLVPSYAIDCTDSRHGPDLTVLLARE
jgi:hypothetical protein